MTEEMLEELTEEVPEEEEAEEPEAEEEEPEEAPESDDGDEESEDEEEAEPPEVLDGEEWSALAERPITRKVNGEEVTRTLSEWVQAAQKAEGAERKFDEAAKLRKEAEEKHADSEKKLESFETEVRDFVNELADPDKVISAIAGLSDRHQWALERAFEKYIADRAEDAKLTPEQKKLRQIERELEEQKRLRQQETAAQKKRREAEERKAKEAEIQAFRDSQTRIVINAMDEAGLSRETNEEDWKAVGRLVMPDLKDALEANENLDPEEVKALVQKYAKRLGVGKAAQAKAKPKTPPKVRDGAAKRAGRPKNKGRKKMRAGDFWEKIKAEADYDEMYGVEVG